MTRSPGVAGLTTRAGTPTAVEPGGMSVTTTALAPMMLSCADRDVAQDARAAADVHAVVDDRDVVRPVDRGEPEGRVLADVDVVADRPGVEDHPAVVPDPDPAAQPDRVRQRDAAGPLDPLGQEPVEQRQGRPDRLGPEAHPPVAEPVDGDRPEPLLEDVAVVRPEVLAEQRQEADPRRVVVPVAPVQRGGALGRGLGDALGD